MRLFTQNEQKKGRKKNETCQSVQQRQPCAAHCHRHGHRRGARPADSQRRRDRARHRHPWHPVCRCPEGHRPATGLCPHHQRPCPVQGEAGQAVRHRHRAVPCLHVPGGCHRRDRELPVPRDHHADRGRLRQRARELRRYLHRPAQQHCLQPHRLNRLGQLSRRSVLGYRARLRVQGRVRHDQEVPRRRLRGRHQGSALRHQPRPVRHPGSRVLRRVHQRPCHLYRVRQAPAHPRRLHALCRPRRQPHHDVHRHPQKPLSAGVQVPEGERRHCILHPLLRREHPRKHVPVREPRPG